MKIPGDRVDDIVRLMVGAGTVEKSLLIIRSLGQICTARFERKD